MKPKWNKFNSITNNSKAKQTKLTIKTTNKSEIKMVIIETINNKFNDTDKLSYKVSIKTMKMKSTCKFNDSLKTTIKLIG